MWTSKRAGSTFRWKISRSLALVEKNLAERQATPEFLAMMKFEVERTREWFHRGLPLAKRVDRQAGTRHRTVQPRRTRHSPRHRAPRLRRAEVAACNLQTAQDSAAGTGRPGKFAVSQHPLQLRAAYSVCRHIARSAAKNFYYGFLVLPSRKRDALSAVYAFMRHADDISDNPSIPAEERREKLSRVDERSAPSRGRRAHRRSRAHGTG